MRKTEVKTPFGIIPPVDTGNIDPVPASHVSSTSTWRLGQWHQRNSYPTNPAPSTSRVPALQLPISKLRLVHGNPLQITGQAAFVVACQKSVTTSAARISWCAHGVQSEEIIWKGLIFSSRNSLAWLPLIPATRFRGSVAAASYFGTFRFGRSLSVSVWTAASLPRIAQDPFKNAI
jgi:hypothetical protein